MLEKWSEPGLGKHLVESLELRVEDEESFLQIQKEVSELDSLLKKYGMKLSLFQNKEEKSILKWDIALDRLKRAAGKKRDYGSAKKVSEVFLYSKLHKSAEVAEYAGVQLRTYQRRVKKYKEEQRWNEQNSSFF
mgnify:CR=1 FL=1